MKFRKIDINEIIDTNGELIGANGVPEFDANANTQANNTTDYNAKVGQQPFRYDMLGRFGFSMMPFMEGDDKNEGQANLENDLLDLVLDKRITELRSYYKNPQKVKSDYRKFDDNDEFDGEIVKDSVKWIDKFLKIVEKHFETEFKNLDEQFQENLVEGKVVEDKMVGKIEDEITSKSDDGGVRDKSLEKIVGLINKLADKDINKLKNLLEKKNG